MNTQPTRVIIERDADIIVDWSAKNEHLIHDAVLVGVQELLTNPNEDGIILIEFFESERDRIAFADVALHREDILESLQLAEEFYVHVEDYEKALDAKNLLSIANIKLTEQ
jgi:hypothetical protein